MAQEFTLRLSPGETLENIKLKFNTDNTVTIIPITKVFKHGDFVALDDGSFAIIDDFTEGLYTVQWRINKLGNTCTKKAINPYCVRCTTEKETDFILDILHDYSKYLDINKNVKPKPRFSYGDSYYSVQVVNDNIEPVELTWEDSQKI